MRGDQFISDQISVSQIVNGKITILRAPTGAGKTEFAINRIAATEQDFSRILYLIDTRNGQSQLLRNPLTEPFSEEWRASVSGKEWRAGASRIVVMTYAKFGSLARADPSFGAWFHWIICDEVHNLVGFMRFGEQSSIFYRTARDRLIALARAGATRILGMSATPEMFVEELARAGLSLENGKVVELEIDRKRIRSYETRARISFRDVVGVVRKLPHGSKGIVYTQRISQMRKIISAFRAQSIPAVAIWSTGNQDHPMTGEQMEARKYLLEREELPPGYDVVVINASSETAINIRGEIDWMVVNSSGKTIVEQVRGRYRGDLGVLYVRDGDGHSQDGEENGKDKDNAEPKVGTKGRKKGLVWENMDLDLDERWLGRPLFKGDWTKLVEEVAGEARDEHRHKISWPKVREKLVECEYVVREGKEIDQHGQQMKCYTISIPIDGIED